MMTWLIGAWVAVALICLAFGKMLQEIQDRLDVTNTYLRRILTALAGEEVKWP